MTYDAQIQYVYRIWNVSWYVNTFIFKI